MQNYIVRRRPSDSPPYRDRNMRARFGRIDQRFKPLNSVYPFTQTNPGDTFVWFLGDKHDSAKATQIMKNIRMKAKEFGIYVICSHSYSEMHNKWAIFVTNDGEIK